MGIFRVYWILERPPVALKMCQRQIDILGDVVKCTTNSGVWFSVLFKDWVGFQLKRWRFNSYNSSLQSFSSSYLLFPRTQTWKWCLTKCHITKCPPQDSLQFLAHSNQQYLQTCKRIQNLHLRLKNSRLSEWHYFWMTCFGKDESLYGKYF